MDTAIAGHRLYNQRICAGQFQQPEDVVRWMGAMQAQDYGQAVWAIGRRTQSATLADVEQAIAGGKMLRTWPMRGTIHFVPPENAKWMLRLSADRMLAAVRSRQQQLELDEAILEECKQVFYDALHGGRRLSRAELLAAVEAAGISSVKQRGYHILWYAAQTGQICIGPMEGKQQTFVLLDEWAPNARELSREESLAALAGSYFRSHGPATVHDFAWWAGLPVKDAREAVQLVQPALMTLLAADKEYWLPNEPTPPEPDPEDIALLAGFDEYLLGYTRRDAALPDEHADKVVPGGNGVFRPMIVAGSQIVGTWKRTIRKTGVDLVLSPFEQLHAPQERLQAAAERYAAFLGLALSGLSFEPA